MATAVIMPKYEMAQETGTVARWLKNEGESVSKGDPLLEVETDKVTMEVEAPASGLLVQVTAQAGKVVPIGQPIAYIAAPGERLPDSPIAAARAETPAPATPPEPGPAAGTRATPVAERVARAHGVDLSTVSGSGPQGRVMKADVEGTLARQVPEPAAAPLWPDGKIRAVPAARRLARELQVDLQQVAGSGPEGRIQGADVLAAAELSRAQAAPAAPAAEVPPSIVYPATGPAERQTSAVPLPDLAIRRTVPLTSIRRTIAERMTASVREAPQFNLSVDARMERAQSIVEDLRAMPAAQDSPKITLTALLVKACAWALATYPAANASFNPAGEIVEWADINVGVATATDQGLLVPVIHRAAEIGVREIAARLNEVASRAREGKLRLEDIQGGTFTVSNLGMFGIDQFTAILNPPQAAILAIGRIARRPVISEDDQISVQSLATLTLTADHRVLDGAAAAHFLALIRDVLEHPGILLA